jgi:TRAP-type C4-dicarboxylate transport system substrate-binding protein
MKDKGLLFFFIMVLGFSFTTGGWSEPIKSNVIVLKFGTWHPQTPKSLSDPQTWFFNEMEKRIKRSVKVEPYGSGSLVPAKELLSSLDTGISDIALLHFGNFPGKCPLHEFAMLPVIGSYLWTLRWQEQLHFTMKG